MERLLEIVRVGVEKGVGDGAADIVDDDVEPSELFLRGGREGAATFCS
jgi:hypothetical protein